MIFFYLYGSPNYSLPGPSFIYSLVYKLHFGTSSVLVVWEAQGGKAKTFFSISEELMRVFFQGQKKLLFTYLIFMVFFVKLGFID